MSRLYAGIRGEDEMTEEEIREFWELCGLFHGTGRDLESLEYKSGWYKKSTETNACWFVSRKMPEINLNNIGEYAVPLLGNAEIQIFTSDSGNYYCQIKKGGKIFASPSYRKSIADALSGAIYPAITEIKER